MTKVHVLRTVRVADGTVYGREIAKGTEAEIPDDMYPALESAGYVKEVRRRVRKDDAE